MTQRQLSALCLKWKRRLPILANWKVRARFVASASQSELGRVEFWPEMLKASVYILRPEDRGSDPDENKIEADVVHELVHLVLDGHSLQQKYDLRKEQAINCLAEALWRAYQRRKRPRTTVG